jgi:hypothetical protein
LHCGADELHWSTFRRAMDSLARVQNTVFCTIPDEASFGRAINLTSCRAEFHLLSYTNGITLLDEYTKLGRYVLMFSDRKCQDDRE